MSWVLRGVVVVMEGGTGERRVRREDRVLFIEGVVVVVGGLVVLVVCL